MTPSLVHRSHRGNIILTALFVAIFLFFLSVALIWTNRQDIALSLSMEHKLKAQSAARTGAYEAYARLRQFGELNGYSGAVLPSGAEVKVQLVKKEADQQRGEVLLLQSRGRSGPVSTFYNLHLLQVKLFGDQVSSDPRALFLLPPPGGSGGKTIFGDFILRDGGKGLTSNLRANNGPLFSRRETRDYPPEFWGYIPVFENGSILGWGPIYLVAPRPPQAEGLGLTALTYLKYDGEEFVEVPIEEPVQLGDPEPEESLMAGVFVMEGPETAEDTWSNGSVLGQGANKVQNFVWRDPKPPTRRMNEALALFAGNPRPAGRLVDWAFVPRVEEQKKFCTRGAIYAVGNSVYSHGWHFQFQQFRGVQPAQITPLEGSKVTRWPCLLKYTLGKGWSIVWTPLNEDGEAKSPYRPDPRVLMVSEDGKKVYTVTEPVAHQPRRLLTIDGRVSPTLGVEVPEGELVLYREQPYRVSNDPKEPGLIGLLNRDKIDFTSLAPFVAEVTGTVINPTPETEESEQQVDSKESEAPPPLPPPLSPSAERLTVTAQPRYELSYSITPNTKLSAWDENLWALVDLTVEKDTPSFTKVYGAEPFKEGRRTVLGRYDGRRWNIFPAGLRASLKQGLSVSSSGVVCAAYPELPPPVDRFSVISIDTKPVEMEE